jgi:hypothetical protein
MPAISLKPQTRFLLLGSALLTGMLILWWFVLLNPLLFLLRGAVEVSGGAVFSGRSALTVTEAPSGDWTFEVPLEATLPRSLESPTPRQMHSIDFDLARSDAGAFTFGLPVYWAIMLAAPGIRRNLRPLLLGTLAMAVLEIALLLVTAEIYAHKALAQLLPSQDPLGNWFLHFSEYLSVSAIPYVIPFAVALSMHRELRGQIFHWASAAPLPAEATAISTRNRPSKRPRLMKPARKRG